MFGIRTPSHGLRLSLGRLSDAEISRLAADIAQALSPLTQAAHRTYRGVMAAADKLMKNKRQQADLTCMP